MKKLVLIATLLLALPNHAQQPRVVEIHAKRFEFTPNVVHLTKGQPVTIRLISSDHSHGLLIKPLNVDLDATEGEPDSITITPAQAGTFEAICDDYCGSGHGNMKMTVVVE